jgi:hydroxymethylpyrimidine/phosphomethylpyrimidine kinase
MPKLALSIAGFDPSGGAGVLADAKTFSHFKVQNHCVITMNTIQDENSFVYTSSLENYCLDQLSFLLESHTYEVVKIGLVPSMEFLQQALLKFPVSTKIIWDPILKSSTHFSFHKSIDYSLLDQIDLITPNLIEFATLFPEMDPKNWNSEKCALLLKGGHGQNEFSTDTLYTAKEASAFTSPRLKNFDKHGSGCVLSAAIASFLTLGLSLKASCEKAHNYMHNFLQSSPTKLGMHFEYT